MSTIQEIETAVTQLSPQQLADFRAWFAEFEQQRWNHQLADDVAAGRLDALADEAIGAAKPNKEQEEWARLAAQNLAQAYGDDEPDYEVADLKVLNPAYRES